MKMSSNDEKTGRRQGLSFRKISLDSLRKKIFSETDVSNLYSSTPDEECLVINNINIDGDIISPTYNESGTFDSSAEQPSSLNLPTVAPASISSVRSSPSHVRSHSDGSWAVLKKNNPLSASSGLDIQNTLYSRSADNGHHFGVPISTSYADCTILGKRIDGEYNYSVPSNTTGGNNDDQSFPDSVKSEEKSENISYSSRFPRPKPGESLISFLSSADLYKNCGMLDRENAHFYISEALMAAFEQMRFETDCRAVGLMDSGDDSDEEIKNLQDQIRQKRQMKLGITQQRRISEVDGNGANPIADAALPSASTTDYSVYESPKSSTHTESSDQLSDCEHGSSIAGFTKLRSNIAAYSRTKRKTLKRSTPRTQQREMFSQSSNCGDTSDVCHHDTAHSDPGHSDACSDPSPGDTGSGSSCCTLANVPTSSTDCHHYKDSDNQQSIASEVSTVMISTTGIESSNKDNENGQRFPANSQSSPCSPNVEPCVAGQQHTSCEGSPGTLCVALATHTRTNDFSCGGNCLCCRHSVDSVDGALQPTRSSEHNSSARTHAASSTPQETIRRIPDHRSAEGIGLRLLQHLATPQHQLPAASELQWLVSERDAPQKLLPLPCGGDTSGQLTAPVLLRGTPDWAPPREQLILTVLKQRKRSAVLTCQKYRCAGCGQQVSPALSKHYRLCHYFMRYFCATCHMNKQHIIPAKVLHQWDIKPCPVSCFADQFLTRLYRDPLFYPSAINPALYHTSKALNQFRLYRMQLFRCLPYVTTCSRARSEHDVLRESCPGHWCTDGEVLTLQELVAIKRGISGEAAPGTLESLHSLTAMCLDHVANCQVCRGKGFICEVCQDPTAIFPFELASVRVCGACGACTHYRCKMRSSCTRCVARNLKKRTHVVTKTRVTPVVV